MAVVKNLLAIKSKDELLKVALWLEGKTLEEVVEATKNSDESSRVTTKGNVGYVIENGFFGIKRNSSALPDIEHLEVEIKTCPLKYNSDRTRLSVKEPLSLNIINYFDEVKHENIKESSLYKKNKTILFVFYIHDFNQPRSQYKIIYVFLWNIDEIVLEELQPDYNKIIEKIKKGQAHQIHQGEHKYLTLCPKHGGKFKDPNDMKSKRKQPFSKEYAEIRAFRLKNIYMNKIICRKCGFDYGKGGWLV